uniref:Uncharacterized protein n=1 Tax=Setaria digitata TaxID=48799 RepID=A0A915PN20_9BILA
MASFVQEFIKSLEGQVAELPDTELADLAEDSRAVWAQKETAESKETVPDEFSKRRLIVAQELDSERYEGRKISSKKVFTGDDICDIARPAAKTRDSEDSDTMEDEEDSSDSNSVASNSDQQSFSCDDNDRSDETSGDGERSELKEIDGADKSLVTISNDVQHQKAESVRKQLMIWDRLMQLHILSHAALRVFNELPREELAMQLEQSADNDTIKNCKTMRKNLEQLNKIFTTMEDSLLKSSKHTKGLLINGDGKGVGDSEDEEIESSTDDEEHDDAAESDANESGEESVVSSSYERQFLFLVGWICKRKKLPFAKEYAKRHERFMTFRSSALSKWDERMTLSTIGLVKNKKKDFSAFESVVLKQIEQIMSEKHRLLRRTQMKRHDVERIGGDEDNNYDAEIFDDDDFYQQLLKELIERKSANVVDPIEMSRQWLEIQKLRQKRSKRKKVDTKASKGRKIRYVVIPKLVNFFPSMAEKAKWSHERRNQLFKSLFAS